MWSVKCLPNPGSARIDSRSASVAGLDARITVNSREPLVMGPIVYPREDGFFCRVNRWRLPRFHGDERGAHHFAFDGAAADVDGDLLAVVDPRGGVDQCQPDADLQCRRKRSRGGYPYRGVP